jgi:hypothetical protein
MTAIRSRFLSILLTSAAFASPACAGTLSGTVINRTTGKPEPNVTLDLLSPTAGMSELATTKSDAQGHFSVTKDSVGMAPILIRATFHDVSFNTFAPPGRPNVEVDVFDTSKDPKTISIPSHVIIFEPQDNKLVGAEEYVVQNSSQPPVAYFRTEGNFDFAIPAGATIGQVSTTAAMGMSVAQASIDKGNGHLAIAYPFRPGQTNVRLSYELPYASNSASLTLPASYPGGKILVVVPPGVTVTGDGLVSAGQEQGMMVFTHEPLPAKGVLSVTLSGAPAARAAVPDQGQAQGQEGNSRQGPEVIAAPSRLNDLKWYIFAGLVALFLMGGVLLFRKQIIVPHVDATDDLTPFATNSPNVMKSKKPQPASPPAIAAVADPERGLTMESLKERIFRLELRRQAGTISEDDYAREKSRVDQLLRDMVQG